MPCSARLRSRLLTTSDGGKHWRVTDTVARGVELFPVRGTQTVYALMGDAMLRTDDAGLRWRRLAWGPAVVSFVTPQRGWRLRRVTTLAQPPPLSETGDAGRSWTARVDPCRGDYGVPLDTIAAQSADLLDDGTGFILLRGCRVRLVRTDVAATNATTIDQWNSPTQC